MSALAMIVIALAGQALSGVPALFGSPRSGRGQWLAASMLVGSGVVGLVGVARAMVASAPPHLEGAWLLPVGRLALTVDPLSAFFLVPIFVLPALGSVYALGYWKQAERPANGRKVGASFGVLAGSMALVAIARDGVLFLIAWEIMALAAYFAATAEDEKAEVRRAGWIYLVATHAGTLCLIAMFLLLCGVNGSFGLDPFSAPTVLAAASSGAAGVIFVLALLGFGCKAGLVPLHFWLPGAHANAPSHVSALMSGVMLNMGMYGLLRVASLFSAPPVWWGALVLLLGAATGVCGIAFAIGQRDLKRMLAYSSVENLGVAAIGVGLALLGRTFRREDWVLLGLGGALLHLWNHGLFKSLLFLNAGAVIHEAHTQEIDRLGGLRRGMPITAVLFALGAVAICALPPLNGFASEWLIYVGLFHTILPGHGTGDAVAVAGVGAVALATIGALAGACFVQVFGAVFLGSPRTEASVHAHEPGQLMLAPMVLLAAGCLTLGLAPGLIFDWLERAARSWAGGGDIPFPSLTAVSPPVWITLLNGGLLALTLLFAGGLWLALHHRPKRAAPTWGCGYSAPTARMQYTAASFGRTLLTLFRGVLWPRERRPRIEGPFPSVGELESSLPDTVLDRVLEPFFRQTARFLPWLRLTQQGRVQVYLLYFVVVVILLLMWGRFGT
ncbi:MAG: proton-conducting transporter membrane subunit [Planctomycetota bacterium]